ncbi:MAG: DUF4389 domain-containing protein [Acidimicrobiales bacterium]|nr:DUF4389 domain-containing protein [Acidimicrobiales bacterium]
MGLTIAYATARNDAGFFEERIEGVLTPTAAVTSDDIDLGSGPDPEWIIDRINATVAFEATSVQSDQAIFVGIGPASDVESYLSGVAHDETRDLDGRRLVLRRQPGTEAAAPPVDQDFWVASASGVGEQRLEWDVDTGRWIVAVMNADGTEGVAARFQAEFKAGGLLPAALTLIGLGVLGLVVTTLAIVAIVGSGRDERPEGEPGAEASAPYVARGDEPVRLEAHLDRDLSSWKWLVKWILVIPHLLILVVLFIGFVLLTLVAGVAVLFTGRYPRGIFDFNVGVLRWGWRVSYYAFTGGIGTDRYPPFSLQPEPGYPATLDIAYPEQLSRGLVLLKWWLLAIPHYLVLAFVSGWGAGFWDDGQAWAFGGGLLGVLTLIAGGSLLFRRRYPRGLFDLIIGLNRWVYRVVAYAALMTDRYPPFRLDQGGSESGPGEPPLPDGSGNALEFDVGQQAAGDA